ncbi:hypothetical protein [Streptosporangium sp. NPDC020145]|uniref:hypothetical protein n=1 Tax=Streptosporangium sp. NPDC020145 TaxID=3154694 RepID=UPI003449C2EB
MTRTRTKTNLRRPVFGRMHPKTARALNESGPAERRRELLTGLTSEVIEVGAGLAERLSAPDLSAVLAA